MNKMLKIIGKICLIAVASVLAAYCAGDSTKGDENMLCRLRIRKISLSEF